jgi:feruloyl esterase
VQGKLTNYAWVLLAASALLGVPQSQADVKQAPACEALKSSLPKGLEVEASAVAAGQDIAIQGHTLRGLPAICRIEGHMTPTSRSRIGFELWLPVSGWDGRIEMVGNGGYSSQMRLDELSRLARSGTAAVATDTGHQGDGLEFGFDDTDAIADWGYRAVHESIVNAKALVARFYERPAKFSYFVGCSTGGHQGLMEAQRFPADFDGVLAGDPGNNRTNLNFGFLWQFLANHPIGDNNHPILSPEDLKLVNKAAVDKCDTLDGVRDGIITDPRSCNFDPASLRCGGRTDRCLSDTQISALKKMYGGARREDNGSVVYPGWPVGSESVEGGGGWQIYWANPQKQTEPQRVDFFRRWAFGDPNWNWWPFDWSKGVNLAHKKMGPLVDAVDPDLTAFRRRGGKLIVYQGTADPVVSATDTISYYSRMSKKTGAARSFSRLFMVPGMAHCMGGPGASNFNSGADAGNNVELALQSWVEQARAPEKIVAVKFKGRTPDSGIQMSRPICAWPKLPAYKGSGDTNDATNFICR